MNLSCKVISLDHFDSNLEKNILINRDNQVLLNKLVEISHGKWVRLLMIL